MDETTFDWDNLRLFLAVARGGGLAPAAAATGKSAPTLGRRMVALERRLGRELFRRMARGYALTDDGEALFARAVELESHVRPIAEAGTDRSAPVVKVSAGHWVAHTLCGQVGEIVGADRIRLRFIAAGEVLDIARREALIGIRNHRPEGVGLAGRKIGRVRFAVFALDPGIRVWAHVLGTTPSAKWVQQQIGTAAAIEVTDPRNALDLALAGAARVVLPTFVGAQFDALKQVSPLIDDLEHEQWLVTHHEDRFIPHVRKVIDRIDALMSGICATA